jgi:hypothetical protein
VGREPVLADVGVIYQTTLDHVPAQQSLQSAHEEQRHQFGHQSRPHPALEGKVQHGQQEDHPDQPPQYPVQVLVHEDVLEAGEIHAAVDFLILGILFVFFESLQPGLLTQGRDDPHQRLPLDHGEP